MELTEQYKLESTLSIIERFNGGLEKNLDLNTISKLLKNISEKQTFIGTDIPDSSLMYRCRLLNHDTPFENINELTVRKKENITDYGRCHSPGEEILYASTTLNTALSEIGVDKGQKVQLLIFKKKKKSNIVITAIGEIDHLRRNGKLFFDSPERLRDIKKSLEELSVLEALRIKLTDAFIADFFRKEVKYPYEYKVTSTYSKNILENGFDGFYYPSVAHKGGFNIAIKKECFDKEFEIVDSSVLKINNSLGYGIYSTEKLFSMNKISNEKIEFIKTKFRYSSIDMLIWENLKEFKNTKYLIMQTFKNISDVKELKKLEEYKSSNELKDDTILIEFTTLSTFQISTNNDFKKLKATLLASSTWDYAICHIVESDKKEIIEQEIKTFVKTLKEGKVFEYSLYDFNGDLSYKHPVFLL